MKKLGLIILLVAVAMFWCASAFAAAGDVCADCHSMHATDGAGNDNASANDMLLTGTCVGCHTGTVSATGTPKVDSSASPTTELAGGNFYWVGASGDAFGHNVAGVDSGDGTLGNTPPGNNDVALTGQLTCAGTLGCHGDTTVSDPLSSLSGAHHANTALTITATQPGATGAVGASYRFLKGVKGVEDGDWEYTVAAGDHNQYFGAAGGDAQSIAALCANCHGDFHSTANTQSGGAWVRHPTDLDLQAAGGEHTSYATYDTDVPVASNDMTALTNTDVQTAGKGIVTCLSCHRAHASDKSDLLRFTYGSGAVAGEGCFVCHSNKD